MVQRIQFRRGTAAFWTSTNPTLSAREIGIETDTLKMKVGDGSTAWNSLSYASAPGPTGPTGATGNAGATGPTGATGPAGWDDLFFGDGSDGDVTLTSGTTNLTRNYYYNNLTIQSGAILNVGATYTYQIFVKGTLNLSGATSNAIQALSAAGANASGATRGTGGTAKDNGTIGGAKPDGVAGATGATGNGVQPADIEPTAAATYNGGAGGAGGQGGTGSGGTAAGSRYKKTLTRVRRIIPEIFFFANEAVIKGGLSGQGGSSGAGDSTNAGGGGGGGGGGGPNIYIAAYNVTTDGSTYAGAIQSAGRNGGNGGTSVTGNTGGGGGGGAGGGGFIFILYKTKTGATVTDLIKSVGGNGGAGGNGKGTGTGGYSGGGGDSGSISLINIATRTITEVLGTAGDICNAPSGTTGGSAASGTIAVCSL